MNPLITCRELVDRLDEYLAGVLPRDQQQEVEAHLAACPSCVAYLKTYQASVALGRAVLTRSEEPVPESVPEDLIQAILGSRRPL